MRYYEDAEYMAYVGYFLDLPQIRKLEKIPHHHYSNRLAHSISVSYTSYRIAKKFGWNARSIARGGLFHDLFYYDCRVTKFKRSHAWVHPRLAVRNAKKLTALSRLEEDIIVKHMWGLTWAFPRYKESYIVTIVDKYCAIKEFSMLFNRIKAVQNISSDL